MTIKTLPSDILITGGGIAGLALAALLGRAGLKVSLIEPFPPETTNVKPSGRTVALMESSLNIIKATGVWDSKIRKLANPLQTMRIIDDSRAGQETIEIEFPATDIGLEQFGFNIPNAILRAALYERVQTIKNVKIYKQALASYETSEGFVRAELEDGTILQSPLIVGADGRNSLVRKNAGIEITEHDYHQKAITCLINHSRSHNHVSTEFHRPSGPFALVPLGNQSSVVWVEREARADDIMKLKKDEFVRLLQDQTLDILGGITLETNPECWPLRSITAEKLTAPRTVLIAEAAHVMSPITAQGLNLSLRDAATLAEIIVDTMRVGLDAGAATTLSKYERRRRLDVNTRVFGVDRMNKIVSTQAEFIKAMRRGGLKTFGTIDPLKKIAMQTGLVPQLDLGRLARGEKL